MTDYQQAAVEAVGTSAREANKAAADFLKRCGLEPQALCRALLSRPITLNFHPDRVGRNGKTVLENLLEQGQYRCQYETGITNGGTGIYPGGNRFQWEQRMFRGAYPPQALDRPKYGALNLLNDQDGASARFGSCYLELKEPTVRRATFSYGDSADNPTVLCTWDTFARIGAELIQDIDRGKLLNRRVNSREEGLARLMGNGARTLGHNLDDCVEVQIHGELSLEADARALYLDGSYQDTEFSRQAETLCRRYGLALGWIPERRVRPADIPQAFRGPGIPVLAGKILERFGGGEDAVNAFLLGRASRDSAEHPENWSWLGSEKDVFQAMKQLWHAIGYFG